MFRRGRRGVFGAYLLQALSRQLVHAAGSSGRGTGRIGAGFLGTAGVAADMPVQHVHADAQAVAQGIGHEAVAQAVDDARAAKDVAHVAAAHHQHHRHTAGIAAFEELLKGVGAGGIQPEHAGQVQDHQPGRRVVLFVELALQLMDGTEEERAFDDVDHQALGHVVRGVAHGSVARRRRTRGWAAL